MIAEYADSTCQEQYKDLTEETLVQLATKYNAE
jgi:hypothetical protein